MFRFILLLMLSFAMAPSQDAHAQQDTKSTNFWMTRCNAPMYSDLFGDCLGFIQGFDSGITMPEIRNGSPHGFYCLPTNVTYGQVVNIVKNYAARNPQKTHFEFGIFLTGALAEAFPCSPPPSTNYRR